MAAAFTLKSKEIYVLKGAETPLSEFFDVVEVNISQDGLGRPISGIAEITTVYFYIIRPGFVGPLTGEDLLDVSGPIDTEGSILYADLLVSGNDPENDNHPLSEFTLTFSKDIEPGKPVVLSLEDQFL